jgi:hypothetical protein
MGARRRGEPFLQHGAPIPRGSAADGRRTSGEFGREFDGERLPTELSVETPRARGLSEPSGVDRTDSRSSASASKSGGATSSCIATSGSIGGMSAPAGQPEVRKAPCRPRSWTNFSLL